MTRVTGPNAETWLGYPKAAWLVIGVEACERFSFYAVLSLFVLFLTGDSARGGFGWTSADALALLGVYSGAMYAFPALGGYVADRIVGRQRAIGLGLGFMLLGQALLVSPVFLPAILGIWRHAPLLQALHELGVPQGYLRPTPPIISAIQQSGVKLNTLHGVQWLREAYALTSWGFYTAIVFLILGNALMKSSLVVVCGDTFAAEDVRRESAYSYYYLGIALGAVSSGVIVGAVADRFGWNGGFLLGTAGVLVAFGVYVSLAPRWLGDIGLQVDRERAPDSRDADDPQHMKRVRLLGILAFVLCVFSAGWFQLFGTWTLFIQTFVDRSFYKFMVPVPWFGSLDAAVAIAFAPVLAALWVRLAVTKTTIDLVQKYVFALAMAAIAHVVMYLGAQNASEAAPAPLWVPLIAVTLLAIGELVAWTATYAVVSRAAPAGLASLTMGVWYMLTLGLGGYLSGFAGRIVESLGFAHTFILIGAAMGAAAAVTLVFRGPILRLASRAGVSM